MEQFGCCMRKRMILISLVLVSIMARTTGATCNEEQASACRQAATENRLDGLRSGGECTARQYMEFSHVCTVLNYLPSADYCCCVQQTNIMCCRYHQAWSNFRCEEPVDVIGSVSSAPICGADSGGCPSLDVLLPAILVPLFVSLACCATVLWRYRQRRRLRESRVETEEETNDKAATAVGLSKNQIVNSDGSMSRRNDRGRHSIRTDEHPNTNCQSRSDCLHDHANPDPRRGLYPYNHTEPSAPPLDDVTSHQCAFTNIYHNTPQHLRDLLHTRTFNDVLNNSVSSNQINTPATLAYGTSSNTHHDIVHMDSRASARCSGLQRADQTRQVATGQTIVCPTCMEYLHQLHTQPPPPYHQNNENMVVPAVAAPPYDDRWLTMRNGSDAETTHR